MKELKKSIISVSIDTVQKDIPDINSSIDLEVNGIVIYVNEAISVALLKRWDKQVN